MAKQFTTFFIVLIVCFSAIAQSEDKEEERSLDSGSITDQFDYVIEESNRYEQYKVVKIDWLNKLKSNVTDSLMAVRQELKKIRAVVSDQKAEIVSLKEDLEKTRQNLTAVNNEKESISFLGAPTTKGTYKTIMWSLVAILFLLMLFFIFRFQRSNLITTEARASLAKLNEEFESFRKSAREREQKIKRELQDEINKHL